MPSSKVWRGMGRVRTDVSEEYISSIIRVKRISELRTALEVSSNLYTLGKNMLVIAKIVPNSPILITLIMEVIHYSELSVPTRGSRRDVPAEGILQYCSRLKVM
jgi:hypothetical protein